MNDVIKKRIAVYDDEKAESVIGSFGLRKQHQDDPWVDAGADSRARIGKKPGPKYRYDYLSHTGGKNFDGIDDPSPDADIPQFTEQEMYEGPDDSPSRAIVNHPALITRDSMQLYRASQRFLYEENAGTVDKDAQDPNHLDYWLARSQEKLDAFILPSYLDAKAYRRLEPGLARLKETYPDLKIIMVQERVGSGTTPPLVDAVVTRRRTAEVVRDILGMPQLPKPAYEEIVAANHEQWRLKLLNKGVPLDGLPAHLRRPEDTDKRMR